MIEPRRLAHEGSEGEGRPAGEGAARPDANERVESLDPSQEEFNQRWTSLVERIRCDDEGAMEELYSTFARGVRYYLCRHLGVQELDDKIHDTFLIVMQAIRNGSLREPARLMGFIRTVGRRQVAAFIDQSVQGRRDFVDLEVGQQVQDKSRNPELEVIELERTRFMYRILKGISERDREILTRFYLFEQSQDQICAEMSLTETQFRLLKSRAKARFGELGRKKLGGPAKEPLFLRKSNRGGH